MKIGPRYKICRRLGNGVFEQCQSQAYLLSEARHQRGARRGRARQVSDFGKQLLEKQKVRLAYGVPERQLRRYVDEASKRSDVAPTQALANMLESRIDNVVFRSGLAPSRRMARQLVSHGHITIDGRKITIPSHMVTEGDQYAVRAESREKPVFAAMKEQLERVTAPHWLSFDTKNLSGTVKAQPSAEQTDMVADLSSVLEFYSR